MVTLSLTARCPPPSRAPRPPLPNLWMCFGLFCRPGELAEIFSGSDFEILIDEQGELPTRGSVVPANFFACRKMPSAP